MGCGGGSFSLLHRHPGIWKAPVLADVCSKQITAFTIKDIPQVPYMAIHIHHGFVDMPSLSCMNFLAIHPFRSKTAIMLTDRYTVIWLTSRLCTC